MAGPLCLPSFFPFSLLLLILYVPITPLGSCTGLCFDLVALPVVLSLMLAHSLSSPWKRIAERITEEGELSVLWY